MFMGVPIVALVFGWPSVITSLALIFGGIARERWRLVFAGVVIGVPFLFYLSGTPRFGWMARVVMLLNLGAVAAIARFNQTLAVILATPFALLTGWVLWIVINQ